MRVVKRGVFSLALLVTHILHAEVLEIPEVEVAVFDSEEAPGTGGQLDLSQDDIEQQGSISVTDFLSNQGIVQVNNSSSQQNQTSISLRGFGDNAASNSLILIDGLPLTSFTHLGPNLNSVMLESINGLSIKPGSYGSLYGDQAVGGVVSITTQVPKELTKASLSLGNLGQKLGEFYWSRQLSSELSYSLGGLSFESDHYQPHNQQNNFNFNGKLDWQGDHTQSTLNFLAYRTDIEIPQGIVWGKPPRYRNTQNQSTLDGLTFYATHQWFIDDDWRWQSGFVAQNSSSKGIVNIPFSSHQSNWRWQNTLSYVEKIKLGVDVEQQYYDLRNIMQDNQARATVGDIYGRVKWPVTRKVDLIAGVRYANQFITAQPTARPSTRTSSHVLVDEQGIRWQVNDNWNWYVRRDTNYRFAKANEKVWVPSNVENLKTQTGVSFESGIEYSRQKTRIGITVYRLDLDNEISYDPEPSAESPFGQMVNLEPTKRLGVDGYAEYSINPLIRINTQLSIVNATFRQGLYQGNKIPAVSPVTASAGITFERESNWSLNINEKYSGATYALNDLNNSGNKLPGFFTTSVYWQKQIKQFSFGVQIDNLFDKHYARFANYYEGNPGTIIYYPDDGISVLVKAAIKVV